MEEYPRTVAELECSFGTEAACREYLHRLRFPEGFRCPRCQGRTAWTTQRNLLVCAACQYQLSLTAGTRYAQAVDDVVPRDLVGYGAEERRQCAGLATGPWIGKLRDCLDLAA